MNKVYFYLVYESFFRYKDMNKFHDINLTTNQVSIKEKYLDKDNYKMEFFEVAPEYADKVMKYMQDKHIKSSFPINMKAGELQASCSEFIHKCNNLMVEKIQQKSAPLMLQPPPLPEKAVAMIKHKETNFITVVCNSDMIVPSDFISHLLECMVLQVCQHAILLAAQVDTIVSSFNNDFRHMKTPSTDLNLIWYKTTEQEVTQWLKFKNAPDAVPVLSLSPNLDDFVVGDSVPELFFSPDETPSYKKRKAL